MSIEMKNIVNKHNWSKGVVSRKEAEKLMMRFVIILLKHGINQYERNSIRNAEIN